MRHPLARAKIGPVISHISETCKIEHKLTIIHTQEVAYVLSIGTKIGDLE